MSVWNRITFAQPWRLALIVLCASTLLLVACDNAESSQDPASPSPTSDAPAAAGGGDAEADDSDEQDTSAGGFEDAITDVVEEARPSVVLITTQQMVGGVASETLVPSGVGSGVIIDQDGHILTNNHVIEGASGLTVRLADGRELPAEIVGQDPQTDLAVIRVVADDLTVAAIGSSDDLEVGEWVVAIGNALGLVGGPTVTTGVVSAVGRTVQEPPGPTGAPGPFLFDLVQTDAPINPGNSGGPLLNLDGEVVGINTLVAGGGAIPAQGIGFAIAIDTAMPLAEEMIETGRVVHPYLGILYVPLNALVAAQIGSPRSEGALVREVLPGSPAADAGLQPGDVIVGVEGDPIEGESDLPRALDQFDVGDEVTLEIARGEETLEVTAVLRQAPNESPTE